jgi:hypothetical protein
MKPFRPESMKQIAEMRPFTRKKGLQGAIGSLEESAHSLTEGWSRGRMVKAGLIAGGLAALTAGSTAISGLRRENAERHS